MVDQNRSDIALLYRRAGFGLRPDELDRLAAGSYQAAVDGLLAGLGSAPDPAGDQVPVPDFVGFQRPDAAVGTPAFQTANRARTRQVEAEVKQLQSWWMQRMIVTDTPLREKLTLFWHGHFATAVSKVRDAKLMYLQNQLFRSAGSGGFDALTQAVAKDGAMMLWLDTGTDKKAHPNENFAREMMELFTLGIGNYTQDDVTAAARGFTGWVYDRQDYQYYFEAAQHDFGSKSYLGQTGDWNGEDIINIATTRPESARFVLAGLWSHFAYPVEPGASEVTDILPAYGGDMQIGSALGAIFNHPNFRSNLARSGLVKQPIEYLAGAARALGLDASVNPAAASTIGSAPPVAQGRSLPQLATALGQAPFDPPNVGGWGQNAYWLDTATAQIRLDVAIFLARRADLTALDEQPVSQRVDFAAQILGIDGWGSTSRSALEQVVETPVELMALALTAPEYVCA